MEKKIIKYFENFQLIDLLGFGNILGVKENDNFEEYVTEIILAFLQQDRKKRKALLKLAKDISENNINFDKIENKKDIE